MHIVIRDGAGFHQDEGAAELPANVRVIRLPPYSPELNPVERLWDVVQDRICNRVWKALEELMAAINGILAEYWTTPEKVRALIVDGWLLDTENASYPSVLAA
jgi:transposase